MEIECCNNFLDRTIHFASVFARLKLSRSITILLFCNREPNTVNCVAWLHNGNVAHACIAPCKVTEQHFIKISYFIIVIVDLMHVRILNETTVKFIIK